MPTKQPRINTVLEPPVYQVVQRLARADRVSLSQKMRDLVLQALELIEDEGLEHLVEQRRKTTAPKWIPHDEFWSRQRRGTRRA